MILGTRSTIMNVDAFMAGLQQARQGVVQVHMALPNPLTTPAANTQKCTGWLLTDRLVMVPAYVLANAQNATFSCKHQLPDGSVLNLKAEILFAPVQDNRYQQNFDTKNNDLLGSGLLQLEKPLSVSVALQIETQAAMADDQLLMLQYAAGLPGLSLAIGQVIDLKDERLSYKADSMPGSGGGPLFSLNWRVIGMHALADGVYKTNQGLTISKLLDGLRHTPVWPDIAAFHKLADLSAAPVQAESIPFIESKQSVGKPYLLRAAVFWDVDPAGFSTHERAELDPLVVSVSAKRLTLRAEERQRLLESAPSLAVLKQVRNESPPSSPTDARQSVIDRILLEEPPFDVSDIAEADLPYWLQAVRWFANVVPDLPTPKVINQTLQRRRVRSQFNPIVNDFQGRKAELAKFHKWFKDPKAGPMVVTGIGGVGKSSLVACFAKSLPDETMLIWLDFDRVDLAPDNARSVLTLIVQQASVQTDDFISPELPPQQGGADQAEQVTKEEQLAAEQVGAELARHLTGAVPPLLVLDGFEVAQYAEHHNKIWNVLEAVLKEFPALRIIVSGRAEVSRAELAKRKAKSMHLTGIPRPDAKAWLQDKRSIDESKLGQLLDMANGIPLNLRFIVRLAEAGDDFADLPKLKQEMNSTYLYRRILDRVLDPEIQATNLVADVLVLRLITPDLLSAVVPERLPAGLTPDDVFDRLKNALDLVDTQSGFTNLTGNIAENAEKDFRIRPELQIATLQMLETDDAARVRGIDERAAHWYAQQDYKNNTIYAAELVYHQLRLGNIPGAEAPWRNDCIKWLHRAEENLNPTATEERQWLRKKLKAANTKEYNLSRWEQQAVERIQDKLSRGLHSDLAYVLGERKGRSKNSPLFFYDAWLRYSTGDVEGARKLIKNADKTEGPAGRDQTVLAALLARQVRDYPEADRLLARINHESQWADRPGGNREALAVRAARVRLTVDVAAELDLIALLQMPDQPLTHNLTKWLRPSDVLLPQLQSLLANENKYQSNAYGTDRLTISASAADLQPFRKQLETLERKILDSQWIKQLLDSDVSASLSLTVKLPSWVSKLMATFDEEPSEEVVKLLGTLAVLSQQRKQRITDDLFLHQAVSELTESLNTLDSFCLSIGASLIGVSGLNLDLAEQQLRVINNELGNFKGALHRGRVDNLNDLIRLVGYDYFIQFQDFSTATRLAQVETLVGLCEDNEAVIDWLGTLKKVQKNRSTTELHSLPYSQNTEIARQLDRMNVVGPIIYLLGPDPLEMLCERLLFLPNSYRF